PPALRALGQERRLGAGLPGPRGGRGQRVRGDRRHDRAGASAQRRGAEKGGAGDEAIGRSRGGLSTKIHAVTDALGNPVAFHLTGGQAHDLDGADALLADIAAPTVLADKGYDAEARVLTPLWEAGKTAGIPPKRSRKVPRD